MLAGLTASQEDVRALHEKFGRLDVNKDGRLSGQELLDGLSEEILVPTEELVAGLDADGDGMISVKEFVAAAIDHQKLLNSETVKKLFQMLDVN